MSNVNALEWVQTMFDKETDPTLKFLGTPLDDIDDHATYTAYVHGKYSRMLTSLEKQHESTKGEREALENFIVQQLCETVNPLTNAPYSVALAQRKVAVENKKVIYLKRVELELKYKMIGYKRYLKSVELKADIIPGKQGSANRTMDVEDQTE